MQIRMNFRVKNEVLFFEKTDRLKFFVKAGIETKYVEYNWKSEIQTCGEFAATCLNKMKEELFNNNFLYGCFTT